MDLHLINMTLNQLHLLQKAQRVQAVRKQAIKVLGSSQYSQILSLY